MKTAKTTCIDKKWMGTVDMICEPLRCPIPKVENADISCPDGTKYNDKCMFHCKSNAVMIGNENHMTCQANGLWSLPGAFCQAVCAHSNLLTRNISQETIVCKGYRVFDMRNFHPARTVCRMDCRRHFRASHSQSLHTKIRLVCSQDGVWVGSICQPITCPAPKIVYIGTYNCTNGFNIGSRCQFQCPGTTQYRYSVCKKDGRWSYRFLCPSPGTNCAPPRNMRDIQFTCPKKLTPGATCSVQCRIKGYDLAVEENRLLANGEKYVILHSVTNISCTISSMLYPTPSSLSCVRSCNKKFMGDGWCDFQNNRGYCNWDGGDCCASTVRGGRVRLMFPSLCTSMLCQCIDPFAIENFASATTDSDIGTMRERKMAMKRATRPGSRLIYGYSGTQNRDVTHNAGIKMTESNIDTRKRNIVKPLDSKKDHKIIEKSVKAALLLRQQQFLNKI